MCMLVRFLRDDECGSATIWNLMWLVGFGALLGLGVDTTAAMNAKARLQTVADAASHAAAMDLFPISADAVATAVSYGEKNIPNFEGVVAESDVTLGYWDRDARTFRTSDVPYLNAVRVFAKRDDNRSNALATSFLHMAGFDSWDIAAVAVSTYFGDQSLVDRCRKNGLFAGGNVTLTANNTITGDYCIHGETGFRITQNNVVTCGVELSTPSASGWLSQSVPTPSGSPAGCSTAYETLSNEQMIDQAFVYRSIPSRAELEYQTVKKMVDAFVSGELDNDPFNAVPPYLTDVSTVSASTFNSLSSSGNLSPGTLYVVSCGAGGTVQPRGLVRNIGIYTDCVINVSKDPQVSTVKPNKVQGNSETTTTTTTTATLCDPDVETCTTTPWLAEIVTPALDCDSAIAAGYEPYATLLDTAAGRTYRDGETVDTVAQTCAMEPGANGLWDNVFVFSTAFESGDRSQKAVTFPNNMQLGRIDACSEGGGVRLYAAGSLSTPSGTIVHGSQFVLLGNAKFAAKADGTYGMTVEAVGDIEFAAQGKLGGCSPDERDLASDVVFTVRPVAIVN